MRRPQRFDLIWRAGFAILGWATLIAQYGLMVADQTPAEALARTLKFFSYFTILTNVLVALAMTLPVVAGASRIGVFAGSNSVRAAVTMFAVVVGAVYHLLLAPIWSPTGLQWWVDQGLHTVLPLAMLIDWLMFTPRTGLGWRQPLRWLAFPLAYGAWTLAHGRLTGWHPYWFIDVDRLGLGAAALNFGGLLVFFLVVGLGVVAIDRRLAARDRTLGPA